MGKWPIINSTQAENLLWKILRCFFEAQPFPFLTLFSCCLWTKRIFLKQFWLHFNLGTDDYFQQKTVGLSHPLCPFTTPEQYAFQVFSERGEVSQAQKRPGCTVNKAQITHWGSILACSYLRRFSRPLGQQELPSSLWDHEGPNASGPPLWNRGVFPLFNQIFKPDSAPNKTWKEEKILSVPSPFKLENKQPGCQVPHFSPTSSEVAEILRSKLDTLISVKIQEGITHFWFCDIQPLRHRQAFFIVLSWRSSLNQMPDLDFYYPGMSQEKFETKSQPK